MSRKAIPADIRLLVLIEAGYRCAACRNVLAINLHHMEHVSDGGGNTVGNLLALCPTCHELYHAGTISREAIYAWKLMLVSLRNAFDSSAIDDLLFLETTQGKDLKTSGDGVLKFSRLIGAGWADFAVAMQNGPLILYQVRLTLRGQQIIAAWRSGNTESVRAALAAGQGSQDSGSGSRRS